MSQFADVIFHHIIRSSDMTESGDYNPGISGQSSPQPAATPHISTTVHKHNDFIDPQLTPNMTKVMLNLFTLVILFLMYK